MALSELQVAGRPIVPIRGIPLHTGGYVDAREVASMLSDPESMGQVTGTGVVAYYRDGRGIPRRMWPHEFDDLARCIGMQPQDTGETDLMAILPPGILVFQSDLERYLHGWCTHCEEVRGRSLLRGEYGFNPSPRMTPAQELLIYAGFEDLRGVDAVPGEFSSRADRLIEATRVLDELKRRAIEAAIPFDPNKMPGRRANLVELLRRSSKILKRFDDDTLQGYINEAGYRFAGGRPRNDEEPVRLYGLM